MKEEDGKQNTQNQDEDTPHILPSVYRMIAPPEKKSEAGGTPKEEPEKVKKTFRKRWDEFWQAGTDRLMELFLACCISFFALAQLITSCNNNASTTAQTQQLITAANTSAYAAQQNLQAARNFAASAESINRGVESAVDKLNLQAGETKDLVKTAQATYEAADRPYVGIDFVQVIYWFITPNYPDQQLPKSEFKRATHINFVVFAKNFGSVPGEAFIHKGEFRLNGVTLQDESVPDKPTEIFPTQDMRVAGMSIGGADYLALISGEKILQGDMTLTYSYAGKPYKYCSKMQYSPRIADFINLGEKCGPPWAVGTKP